MIDVIAKLKGSKVSDEWTVESFFSEREFLINEKTADSFYSELTRLLDVMPAYRHDNMGDAISELESNEDDCEDAGSCFFRGQKSAGWGLTSSLYRLLDAEGRFEAGKRKVDGNEKRIEDAERRILWLAKKNGIVRGLSGLEILSILQHHGIPTRLIDVSTDWRVALYFACEDLDLEDGRLFVVITRASRWRTLSRAGDKLVWWDKGGMREESWRQSVWPILLPFSDARMISQQGYFLIGGLMTDVGKNHYNRKEGGKYPVLDMDQSRSVSSLAIEFPRLSERYKVNDDRLQKFVNRFPKHKNWTASAVTIRIPAKFKSDLRRLLERDGISSDSLYPPIMEVQRLLRHAGVSEVCVSGV